ncbi:DUF748 domain-containing protein [Paraliomyxa miuraensis]|uniref:DUF748 domain-containing protein n=1 Tax=Paraliomyxa miuraensis TaxID=376150 RepID=UPI002259F6F0|nr:DUF748 domain-containing protein [Paraliomyxa miuraensis]MCX4241972.1 DUF748 domain-containing protein [Paraliomyxa miuraensis]
MSADDHASLAASPPAQEPEPAPRPKRARRRRYRVPLVLLVVVGLVFTAAAYAMSVAPERIRIRIEERLAERFGGSARVERVIVDWGELRIEAHGVRFDDGERFDVDVERLEIDLSLGNLLQAKPRPAVRVLNPTIFFEAKAATPRAASDRDAEAFSSIEIEGGSLELTFPTDRGPVFLDLSEISAQVLSGPVDGATTTLDLGIDARARIGSEGSLHIHGRASSRTPATAWSMRFSLERFDLAQLNQLWLELLEMDVEHGHLGLQGELRRTPTRLHGRVQPRFEDVALLGANEDALHPMAEALFGHMLMGARSTIPIDRPMTGEQSSLPELLETDWNTLFQTVIQQGYARRLSTLRGFNASIGDVKVDLGLGLLQMFEVVVDTDRPVLEVPLVAIDRVDVVFDPSVTRPGASAHKHVTLWRPTFSFATGVEGSENRLQFDESWLDTISAIPFPTRTLVVHDGRIDVWDLRDETPVNVFVEDIEIEGRDMAHDLHPPGVRGAELSATATVLGEAGASVRMVYEPQAAVPNLDMDMKLEPLSLTTLAPALRNFVGVDAVAGELGFSANLSARNLVVEASVVPDVRKPKLRSLGRGYGLRKLVLGRGLKHLRSHALQFRYAQDPDEGLLEGFFPQLIQEVFLDR